eukprot:8171717-Pyramimonas_sp.AAC.1
MTCFRNQCTRGRRWQKRRARQKLFKGRASIESVQSASWLLYVRVAGGRWRWLWRVGLVAGAADADELAQSPIVRSKNVFKRVPPRRVRRGLQPSGIVTVAMEVSSWMDGVIGIAARGFVFGVRMQALQKLPYVVVSPLPLASMLMVP